LATRDEEDATVTAKRKRTAPPPPSLSELMQAWDALMRADAAAALDLDVALQLEDLIVGAILRHAWTQDEKDEWRWAEAVEAIDAIGWDGAFDHVKNVLAKHPAGTGSDMIETSYKKMQRKLRPSGQHRRKLSQR
jgi:hypothetical protein